MINRLSHSRWGDIIFIALVSISYEITYHGKKTSNFESLTSQGGENRELINSAKHA